MQRRLSTIFAADMVGYSRLMREDESGTIQAFKSALTGSFTAEIEGNRGRIVKTTGDGILAEFDSVLHGVSAALAIQNALATDGPKFRIGINLGDVLEDGDDILGDGVNVAARLEAAAATGGICISDSVYEQVRDRVNVSFRSGGKVELKNLGRPMRIWHWKAGSAAEPGKSAEPQAPVTKPSIAVLPFDNMSNDEEQDVFADGMAEEITTGLAHLPWFFVVARPSAFAYKGSRLDLQTIAKELHVTYLVVGSVRRAGSRLRVTAQLVDAESGTQLWTDRYDGSVEDIFEMQDQVTESVVGAIAPEFLKSEARRAERKTPAQLNTWECVMRGRALLWRLNEDDCAMAVKLFEKALASSPGDGFGAGDLSIALLLQAYYNWTDDPRATLKEMIRMADLAVSLNPSEPWSLVAQTLANVFAHRWDAVTISAAKAAQISPGFAPAIAAKGLAIIMSGKDMQPGIDEINRARRLSPRDGMMAFWLMILYWGYHTQSRYEQALDIANEALQLAPDNPTFRRQKVVALSWLGRKIEARAALSAYLELSPHATTADASRVPTPDTEAIERFVEGLRRVGLPDPD